MLLYHGTSAANAEDIRKYGLHPRGWHRLGNWPARNMPGVEGYIGNPHVIYLTKNYKSAEGHANRTANRVPTSEDPMKNYGKPIKSVVFAVDTSRIKVSRLRGDDNRHWVNKDYADSRVTQLYKDNIPDLHVRDHDWTGSLEICGSCSYYGSISPDLLLEVDKNGVPVLSVVI